MIESRTSIEVGPPYVIQYNMLTKRKRRVLFWSTLGGFVVLSIATLFYSLGYRIGPEWQIQKTGGVFIRANETGADVFVDGEKSKTTSLLTQTALIKHLTPRTYEIRVARENFVAWQKFILVTPEIVQARDVILAPIKLPARALGTTTPPYTRYTLKKGTIVVHQNGTSSPLYANVNKFWELPKSNVLLVLDKNKMFYAGENRAESATTSLEFLIAPSEYIPRNVPQTLSSLLLSKQNIIFSDDEQRIIYWDDHTIGSYWIGEEQKMPQWQATRALSIFAIPSRIREMVTYPQHADYLIISMGNGIWMLEMDAVGGQNFVPLYQGNNPQIITKQDSSLIIFDTPLYYEIELP